MGKKLLKSQDPNFSVDYVSLRGTKNKVDLLKVQLCYVNHVNGPYQWKHIDSLADNLCKDEIYYLSHIELSLFCIASLWTNARVNLAFCSRLNWDRVSYGHRDVSISNWSYVSSILGPNSTFIGAQYWRDKWWIWDWYLSVAVRHPAPI